MKENGFTLKQARSRQYPTETIMDADVIVHLANTPIQAESLLHSLEEGAGGIGLHVNADKMEYMYFNPKVDITTLNGGSLKSMGKFTYLRSSISSTGNETKMQLAKAWTAVDRLSIIWKSNLSDKIKCHFFQAAVVSILLYGCTTMLDSQCFGQYVLWPSWGIFCQTWEPTWNFEPLRALILLNRYKC